MSPPEPLLLDPNAGPPIDKRRAVPIITPRTRRSTGHLLARTIDSGLVGLCCPPFPQFEGHPGPGDKVTGLRTTRARGLPEKPVCRRISNATIKIHTRLG